MTPKRKKPAVTAMPPQASAAEAKRAATTAAAWARGYYDEFAAGVAREFRRGP